MFIGGSVEQWMKSTGCWLRYAHYHGEKGEADISGINPSLEWKRCFGRSPSFFPSYIGWCSNVNFSLLPVTVIIPRSSSCLFHPSRSIAVAMQIGKRPLCQSFNPQETLSFPLPRLRFFFQLWLHRHKSAFSHCHLAFPWTWISCVHAEKNKHKLSYSCDIRLFFPGQGLFRMLAG